MKAVKIAAVAALALGPIALPASVHADVPDSYTVTVSPDSALPGASVSVSAVDGASDTSACDAVPYTLTLDYTKVGGGTTSASVASGTTGGDGSVSTSFDVPSDAASSALTGDAAAVNLAVQCAAIVSSPTPTPTPTPTVSPTLPTSHVRTAAHAGDASNSVTASASLQVAAYSGTIIVRPKVVPPGSEVQVILTNCHGGFDTATFTSWGEVPTAIHATDYDAANFEASGEFGVPDDTTAGRGSVSASCWQTAYPDASLKIFNATAPGTTTGSGAGTPPTSPGAKHGVSSGTPVTVVGKRGTTTANPATPVTAEPTFTG